MKDVEFRDDIVIKINKHTGEPSVWGTIKNWNRLLNYAKEIGLPEDHILVMYDACIQGDKMLGRSIDFNSVFEDLKVIAGIHIESMHSVFLLADELNMDSKEIFSMYSDAMNSEEGKAVIAKHKYTIDEPQLIINDVLKIVRKQVESKVPR